MSVSEESPLTPDSNSNGPSSETVVSDLLAQMQRVDGWHELESDPGLFTALITDFGCNGVAVEEIYDLELPFRETYPTVYGYIFLYNVIEERRGRRAPSSIQTHNSPSSLFSGDYIRDEDFIKKIFFALQKVQNSCASHAIISILLNVKNINLGPILGRLKDETKDMSPEDKGYAIGNIKEIAHAHNMRAQMDLSGGRNSNGIRLSQRTTSAGEAFHFVCFLPIDGRLIELDGLKEFPIDHGECKNEDWTAKLQTLIRNRIHSAHQDHDIRYNLMAVIPDRCMELERRIKRCEAMHTELCKFLEKITIPCKVHYYKTKHHDLFVKLKGRPEIQELLKYDTVPLQSELNVDNDSITYIMNWNGLQIPKIQGRSDSETISVSAASEYQFEDDDDNNNDDDGGDDNRQLNERPVKHFICRLVNDSSVEKTEKPTEEEKSGGGGGGDDNKTVIKRKMERIVDEFKQISDDNDRKGYLLLNLYDEIHNLLPIIHNDLEQYCHTLEQIKQDRKTQILEVERRVHNMDEFLTTFVGFMSYSNLLQELPEFRDYSPPEMIQENIKSTNDHKYSTDSAAGGSERSTNKRIKLDDTGCPILKSAAVKAEALLNEIECSRLVTPNIDLSQWK